MGLLSSNGHPLSRLRERTPPERNHARHGPQPRDPLGSLDSLFPRSDVCVGCVAVGFAGGRQSVGHDVVLGRARVSRQLRRVVVDVVVLHVLLLLAG